MSPKGIRSTTTTCPSCGVTLSVHVLRPDRLASAVEVLLEAHQRDAEECTGVRP